MDNRIKCYVKYFTKVFRTFAVSMRIIRQRFQTFFFGGEPGDCVYTNYVLTSMILPSRPAYVNETQDNIAKKRILILQRNGTGNGGQRPKSFGGAK